MRVIQLKDKEEATLNVKGNFKTISLRVRWVQRTDNAVDKVEISSYVTPGITEQCGHNTKFGVLGARGGIDARLNADVGPLLDAREYGEYEYGARFDNERWEQVIKLMVNDDGDDKVIVLVQDNRDGGDSHGTNDDDDDICDKDYEVTIIKRCNNEDDGSDDD
ncbi:hypothetical protein BC829DRAFT_423963 [Chytridium lagenaria]|nr:hypothetical protein BC829DRAFT_423963 [Chytridium lagenaria]